MAPDQFQPVDPGARLPEGVVRARTVDGTFQEVGSSDLKFRISVYGVIVHDSRVLLVSQWDGFDVPGGAIHKGEGLMPALVREVLEETGMTVKPKQDGLLLVKEDFFIHPTTGLPYHCYLFYYGCDLVGGDTALASPSPSEESYVGRATWLPLDAIESVRFYNPIDNIALIRRAASDQAKGAYDR